MADDAATKLAKKALRDGMVLSAPATNKAVELIVRAFRAEGMLINPLEGGGHAEAEDEEPKEGRGGSD
jgi:hypothetical protein